MLLFSLFKLTNTINRNSNKRVAILRIFSAFSPNNTQSRMTCLRKLQSSLPDMSVFIHCLTIFAQNETHMDAVLLDLYMYYANIGIKLPSPKLRAGAIAVMSILVLHNDQIIKPVSQIFSLDIENIKGFKYNKDYYKNMKINLKQKYSNPDKIDEKIRDHKQKLTENILFYDIKRYTENKNNNTDEITKWFTVKK